LSMQHETAWPIDKGEAPALDLRSGCKR